MTEMSAEGPLIIIGGHEDKEGDKVILKAVAERALSIFDVRLHVLASGDGFRLTTRRPLGQPEAVD
jgi:cyanophycinase-like exopeptidase